MTCSMLLIEARILDLLELAIHAYWMGTMAITLSRTDALSSCLPDFDSADLKCLLSKVAFAERDRSSVLQHGLPVW